MAAGTKTKPTADKRKAQRESDTKLQAEIVALRDGGKSVAEVAKKFKVTTNKVHFLDAAARVRPKDRLKDLAPGEIVALKDGGMSWLGISIRTYAAGPQHFLTQPTLKRLYKEESGKDPNQGHRRAEKNGAGSKTAAKRVSKAAKASKAKAEKTDAARPKAKARPTARRGKAKATASRPS